MRTDDLLEKQSERNQWLDIISRRLDAFAKDMKNNLGIMELIVGSLNRSHKNAGAHQEKVNLTLDTIEQSKRLIEEKSSLPILENMSCKPFYLAPNIQEVIEKNEVLAKAKKILFNVKNPSNSLLVGDEVCFNLALGILFCYTINHLQNDQIVDVSFQEEDSRFISFTIGPAKLDEDHLEEGFLFNILEEPNLCKAHLIFQKQGGGFAVTKKLESSDSDQPHSGGEGKAPAALPMEGATQAPVIELQMLWPLHKE